VVLIILPYRAGTTRRDTNEEGRGAEEGVRGGANTTRSGLVPDEECCPDEKPDK
jgi:hypothetical protein